MKLRSILFWLHLGCGVTAGVVVFIMSVTGALLMYQRQMTAWADMRGYYTTPGPDTKRLSPDAIVASVRQARPDLSPTTLVIRVDPSAPASLAAGQGRTLFVNPYAGAILGEGQGQPVRNFFRIVTEWHRYLAASGENRPMGRMITGASNLAFLFIVLSGMFLWWPRTLTWAAVRNVTWFKGGLPGKARDFNWHNTIGFWSAIPLAAIVAGGVVISYPWATGLVYRAYGEAPPTPGGGGPQAGRGAGPAGRGGPGAIAGGRGSESPGREGRGGDGRGVRRGEPRGGPSDSAAAEHETHAHHETAVALAPLWRKAEAQMPNWKSISVAIPAPGAQRVVFTLDAGDGGQPDKRATLTLDSRTGEVVRWEPLSGQSPGRRARTWLRFAHTGEIYGMAGQTVAGLVSAGGAVLVWTGLSLALRRFANWRRRSRQATSA